jgi:hypothetical protein
MQSYLVNSFTNVSMNDVYLALGNTLGKKGMLQSDTNKLAEYLMSFFGFDDQIIDNRLNSEARDVFYMLEEEGFLTTRQEEVHLERGKIWRVHYWILKTDQIQRMARQENDLACSDDNVSTYAEISDDCWIRSK